MNYKKSKTVLIIFVILIFITGCSRTNNTETAPTQSGETESPSVVSGTLFCFVYDDYMYQVLGGRTYESWQIESAGDTLDYSIGDEIGIFNYVSDVKTHMDANFTGNDLEAVAYWASFEGKESIVLIDLDNDLHFYTINEKIKLDTKE